MTAWAYPHAYQDGLDLPIAGCESGSAALRTAAEGI